MMNEIWKDIPGHEGEYQASTLGRIRSVDVMKERYSKLKKKISYLHEGRILKPWCGPGGYLTVSLYKDGVMEDLFVHRLVAFTFLENPKGYKSVSFRDKNKYNTKLENLRWGGKGR